MEPRNGVIVALLAHINAVGISSANNSNGVGSRLITSNGKGLMSKTTSTPASWRALRRRWRTIVAHGHVIAQRVVEPLHAVHGPGRLVRRGLGRHHFQRLVVGRERFLQQRHAVGDS